MITTIKSSSDLRKALNENLHGLLTKERDIKVVKEVNNTLGKILFDVRMELLQKELTGDVTAITWFGTEATLLEIEDNPSKFKALPNGF